MDSPGHEGRSAGDRVSTANGIVAGVVDVHTGVRSFKGIPFAAPPVGDLRWKPPQPVINWAGVLQADRFGARPMQLPVFGDMNFRSATMSEDCLYLNMWAPAVTGSDLLPVLVYFYGGGNIAGDGSEPRYDGASLARRGIIVVTCNYRLNVFGFLAHPGLTRESPQRSSGNYGYLDQTAALRWIRKNIQLFGGDPGRVTIAGESAGSSAVSAQMISPLARELIAGAIGSSGSLLGTLSAIPLAEAEERGIEFGRKVGAASLAKLRAMPAEQLLEATVDIHYTATVDGYFLPRNPTEFFESGEQAHVPLLAGWNSEEMSYHWFMEGKKPTAETFAKRVRDLYGDRAPEVLRVYVAGTDEEAMRSATDLAGDLFTGYSTWKWCELHGKTGGSPVYRYLYSHPRPPMTPAMAGAVAGLAGGVITGPRVDDVEVAPDPEGAVHSADIEYFMGNLATNKVYAWTQEDYELSELMQSYYANFVITGDPNGDGLPKWPQANAGKVVQVMQLDIDARTEQEQHRGRYLVLDRILNLSMNWR